MADEKNIKQPYLGFDEYTRQVTRQVQHKQSTATRYQRMFVKNYR